MDASVIICSCNRVESLLETLESLFAMDVPPSTTWEIVVVDNASKDRTAERVREATRGSQPSVHVLIEPQPGKAYALNRALSRAEGRFLVFTDDDALVDTTWLRSILQGFESSGADCIGGPVTPLWLGERPIWLTDRLLNVLAMLDLGDMPKLLTDTAQGPYGVNYAFRRQIFDRIGGFDTQLCARGCGNEDHEIVNRLRASGGSVYYDPQIQVRHRVFPERLTRRYFRRWHHSCGRDRAQLMEPGGRRILGLEGYMLRGFGKSLTNLAASSVRGDTDEAFYQELSCRLYCSYIGVRLSQFFARKVPAPRLLGKPAPTAEGDAPRSQVDLAGRTDLPLFSAAAVVRGPQDSDRQECERAVAREHP